ncbi:MAG: hypothetical protein HQL26_04150 [Candidatus Omnitrophica bacterium]|nr:hypothetical protein [Candidatus Omnitrophota bacterium]
MSEVIKQNRTARYFLNQDNGSFLIENYNFSKTFSNFFPGISGLWGIPMWVFYTNRGQGIASFGIESKDKAIMEFQPANKSYRLTSLQGFRTFIKIKDADKTIYWEPFQTFLPGTDYKTTQTMSITAHDLTLIEKNEDLEMTVTVNYFTLPEEPFAGLVRRVTIQNTGSRRREIEVVDGLPVIIPYGINDWVSKNMCRTVEAWVKVQNLDNKAPYYHLNVEVADRPEVNEIKEGNFFFSFKNESGKNVLLPPLVESAIVFDHCNDFIAPAEFLKADFKVPEVQQTANRTPSAMSHWVTVIEPGGEQTISSLFGYAHEVGQLNSIVQQVVGGENFISQKAARNKELIDQIKNFALTKSSSLEFDLYSQHTFLDNILRGGLPVSLKTTDGDVAFNVYSRKHGDLERDYNYFFVASTFYSQGNGNYRDVNQNRRNDVWFNTDIKDSHLVNFLNLIQPDGYNPLIIKGTTFLVNDVEKIKTVLAGSAAPSDQEKLLEFLKKSFLPGELLRFIYLHHIQLTVDKKEFLGKVLEVCHKNEMADHGEGFWIDHWAYNLDLVESYLSVYPEDLKGVLFDRKEFSFYHSDHYVLPRDKRYVLTDKGVRQYSSVAKGGVSEVGDVAEHKIKTMNGGGVVYRTNLFVKMLCLLANKVATLDPSNIGIEMEADKPSWYDSLNGLPGLLGSSICETYEVKRFAQFLINAVNELSIADTVKVTVFEELATFISGLTNVLSLEPNPLAFWTKANDIKEHYRGKVRKGIQGHEQEMTLKEIKTFLNAVVTKTTKAVELAKDEKGFLSTYFFHEVKEYELIDKTKKLIRPKKFELHRLPLFLEGYVHALRTEGVGDSARKLYEDVRRSDLFDKKLKMYKVNADLSSSSTDIGRSRVFPAGWLENESVWLHMEYKLMLELLRCDLADDFYANFKQVLVPFMKPEVYGRSILENSSFLVSSAHQDINLHGQGFVARLSGSTAEFLHIWMLMNVGKKPFYLDNKKGLVLEFSPALPGWIFTEQKTEMTYIDSLNHQRMVEIPKNAYAFTLFGSMIVVYHNPGRKNTYGKDRVVIKEVHLTYMNNKKPIVVESGVLTAPYALDIRSRKVERVDVFFN